MRIYIANLGKYNEGYLVGEWLDLPATEQEMGELFERIQLGAFDMNGEYNHGFESEDGEYYEEYAIHDYEAPFHIGEYASIEKLNEIAERLENKSQEDLQVILAIAEDNIAPTIEMAIDIQEAGNYRVYTGCATLAEVAEEYIEEAGFLHQVPEHMKYYFDYKSYAEEMEGTFIKLDSDTYMEYYG